MSVTLLSSWIFQAYSCHTSIENVTVTFTSHVSFSFLFFSRLSLCCMCLFSFHPSSSGNVSLCTTFYVCDCLSLNCWAIRWVKSLGRPENSGDIAFAWMRSHPSSTFESLESKDSRQINWWNSLSSSLLSLLSLQLQRLLVLHTRQDKTQYNESTWKWEDKSDSQMDIWSSLSFEQRKWRSADSNSPSRHSLCTGERMDEMKTLSLSLFNCLHHLCTLHKTPQSKASITLTVI